MKKVVLASLLAVSGSACCGPLVSLSLAQAATTTAPASQSTATPAAGAAPQGQVQMSEEEYAAYNAAKNQTAPAAKAAAFEDYLKKYPNSAVKSEVLNQILFAYSQAGDKAKTLDAADRLLAVDPNNIRALTFEVYYRRDDADKMTDPAAKQAALDQVASYAQKGLAAPPPKGMTDAQIAATKQVFQSAIADDDIAKKDNAAAITALKAELAGVPVAQTQTVGPVLQDEYALANAYYTSTPPDYLNCAWYASRVANFAPDAQKPGILQLAKYCYGKYHGSQDGFEKLQTQSQAALDPPADLATAITPAPKPEDAVKKLIADTPDLATLALSDKEAVLQFGEQADADKVFDTIKGKTVELPGAKVVTATADSLTLAVTDDNKQTNTADFTVAMKTPLTTPPAVGSLVNVSGTYQSYTQKPVMITMSDGAVVEPKKETPKPAARSTTTRRRPR